MISTINISITVRKFSASNPEYFAPAFELLDFMPEFCTPSDVANNIAANLPNDMAAAILSILLEVEQMCEDELGIELSNDEINDACTLFHEIVNNHPAIVRIAEGM
jgi:hypothetical protein